MKLTRLDGQAFHRSAPMSFRAKPRNEGIIAASPRLAVAARMAPLRSHLSRPSPVFPAQAGTQGSAGTRE